ncbi:uncharacterized protein DUF3445 [Prosthecobacter fusiformis]|uniref:Uncharacterized protein DUF3445 n=1 Tax=Prosthecobacter fusiformis TaxID=48464 RepID=A0A4R7SPG9_9BACT|nr:heme-dependent oxidative N-demethylase subunit alpha family protein [Prosthecobacter fusiformis]TDU81102.1 uncharacterized protein DUF3445 [Prosthecobacter fusiformis]
MYPDWQRLFPTVDHRFQMGLRVGDAADFWSVQDVSGEVRQQREKWLAEAPDLYSVQLPEASVAMEEARGWIRQQASQCEPDWVLLSEGVLNEPHVLGGEVVFPSSWSLPEKLGLPLSAVHGPVPGLEAELGKSIQVFLSRIQPDLAWERDNWGLSADAELNHHPSRRLPGLTEAARLDSTWLRLERQFLTRLPVSRALLFGIRVSNHRLDGLVTLPGVVAGLLKSLETMEPTVADYKGLAKSRASLIRDLEGL